MDKETVERSTILRGLVGSGIHGVAMEGTDDRDEMGICIEPLEYVIGLKHFEQYIQRDRPEGVRSEPGDLDLTIYSLRKYVRLALKGNPSILVLLHHPSPTVQTHYGEELQDNYWRFNSKHAIRAFLGYMTQQRQRLVGERGQRNVNRPELVEKYGYDTKYAMHMIRLGLQGNELAETGKLSLPMRSTDVDYLLQIRKGEISLDRVLTTAGELEAMLELQLHTDIFPDDSDREWADEFLCRTYLEYRGYTPGR